MSTNKPNGKKNPDFAFLIAFRDKSEVYDWLHEKAAREGTQLSDLLRKWVREKMAEEGFAP